MSKLSIPRRRGISCRHCAAESPYHLYWCPMVAQPWQTSERRARRMRWRARAALVIALAGASVLIWLHRSAS